MSTQSDQEHNRRTILLVEESLKDVFVNVCTEAHRSVAFGSELTGAPGQPVDTGFERGSWQIVFESASNCIIGTNVAYAPVIEDGARSSYDPSGVQRPKDLPGQGAGGKHIKSTVGGNHSVKLTVAGFDRIKRDVVERVKRERGLR